jgi:hypothetical protein
VARADGRTSDRPVKIAVVHLVWGPLGPRPLREFVSSYRRHPAGTEHELVLLFNGVTGEQRPALLAELDGVEHRVLELEAPVQDLAAYAQAARHLEHERLCFLNSYSVFLAPDWLTYLEHALNQPGAALAGASGSWASVRSRALDGLFLPSSYRGVVPERRVAREQLRAIDLERGGSEGDQDTRPRRSLTASVLAVMRTLPAMPEQLLRFEGFPAEHLRTNAFIVDRRTFLDLRMGAIKRKMDAYRLESGRMSFTRQIQRKGLRALVVDRHGVSYDAHEWPHSNTLWQGDQEGLLVADNQTRLYANGGLDRRALLAAFAWGPYAAPRAPVRERALR